LTVQLTDQAEADLAEIWAYLAVEASEASATRFLTAIEAEFQALQRTPLIGPRREQFGHGLRVAFHAPYAIYYLPTEQALIIVRVLHGARDAAAIAEQGGFSS